MSGDFDTVCDGDVTGKSDLPPHHAVCSDGCASGNASLCGDDRVGANFHVVGDLNLVVQFDAVLNHGGTEGGTVDGRGCSNFASVSDGNVSRLGHFVVLAHAVGRESKSIGANHGPGLDDAIAADGAIVKNGDLPVNGGSRADVDATPNACMAVDLTTGFNFRAGLNNGERPDVARVVHFCRGVDVCVRSNACGMGLGSSGPLQDPGKCRVGVTDANDGQVLG